MALNKTQQNYAFDRINQIYSEAVRKYTKKYNSEPDAVIEALTKKGFEVKSTWNIEKYVGLPETAAQKREKEANEKALAKAKAATQAAKDQIMLGDSAEVTEILAKLAKELGV